MTEPRHDPAHYRQMCEPHPTPEAAESAMTGFFDGVSRLRDQFRIADVHVVVDTAYRADDGSEVAWGGASHCGDLKRGLFMLARAYGLERRRLDDALQDLMNPPGDVGEWADGANPPERPGVHEAGDDSKTG